MENILSKVDVANNRDLFIQILKNCVNRDGSNLDALISKLDSSGFFFSPATTQYHCSYYGGLCNHSLDVFFNLIRLSCNKMGYDFNKLHAFAIKSEDSSSAVEYTYEDELSEEEKKLLESCAITGLLHDMCKMGKFESMVKNVKVYSNSGNCQDSGGKYEWKAIEGYQLKKSQDRFLFGTNGETSEFMVRQFIPLNVDESIAIINSCGDTENNSNRGSNIAALFNRYSLPVLLHCADLISCYLDERVE